MCAVFVSSGSLTRFARLRSSRIFSSLLLLSSCSSCRACRMALRRDDTWLPRCGRYGLAWRLAWRGDGRSDDAMRVAERAVSGTRGETRVGTRDAPFLSARFSRSHVAIVQRVASGSSRSSPPWNKIPRRMGAEWRRLMRYTIRTQIATSSLLSNCCSVCWHEKKRGRAYNPSPCSPCG